MLRHQTEQLGKTLRRKTVRTSQSSRATAKVLSKVHNQGWIYFAGLEEPVKYVSLTGCPSHATVQHYLTKVWKLKPPTLVISLIGSACASLSKRFKATLKTGLWKAAESAGCWIISDGFDQGLTKVAGEAARDYTEAYGSDHILMIAIVPARQIAFYDRFEKAAGKTKYKSEMNTVYYPERLSDEESELTSLSSHSSRSIAVGGSGVKSPSTEGPTSEKERRLCAEHNYLFIIEDEEESPNHDEYFAVKKKKSREVVESRIVFERTVLTWSKGTGGAADILANVIDFSNFRMSLDENVITEDEIDAKIASIIHESLVKMKEGEGRTKVTGRRLVKTGEEEERQSGQERSRGRSSPSKQSQSAVKPGSYSHYVELLRQLTEEYAHLLTVFDSDDVDLDGYMTSALLSSAGLDTPKNELNLEQLEIAVRLNRADIARTKIFLEGKRWKKGALDQFMFNVILNDQTEFATLMMENYFNLEDFLSVHVLERLYTECMKKTDFKSRFLEQIWRRVRIYKMDWVMLRDIGRVIKSLLGDFYEPIYLSKHFRHTVGGYASDDSSEDDQKEIKNKLNGFSGHHHREDIDESSVSSKSTLVDATEHQPESGKRTVQTKVGHHPSSDHDKKATVNFKLATSSDQESTPKIVKRNRTTSIKSRVSNQSSSPHAPSTKLSRSDRYSPPSSDRQSLLTAMHHQSTQEDDGTPVKKPCMDEPIPGKRRYLVLPLTGSMLRYQPYVGYINQGCGTDQTVKPRMGRRYLISPSKNGESTTTRMDGKKQVKHHLVASLDKDNSVQSTTIDPDSDDTSKLIKDDSPTKAEEHNPNFVPDHSPSSDDANQEVEVKVPPRRAGRQLLTSLTDSQMTQLKLKELQRVAREKKREKQRKMRHRMAQGKFTIIERLTGKARLERLEELKPAKLANFAYTSGVKFDRPARELMIFCILFGKLHMANVFLSQEKEPISGALTCAILLSQMSDMSDDVTSKEEYEEAARAFEDKAEQVLDECHQEDRDRTQLLLCRKLEFYGNTSAIRIAARGRCIRFMAHPCCQDVLSGVWMGSLSPKSTSIQFASSILTGLCIPLLLPMVAKYKPLTGNDHGQNTSDTAFNSKNSGRESTIEQFNQMRSSVSANNANKFSKFKLYVKRISEFYKAPITRFFYTGALGPGASLKEYISDGWNKVDCVAIILFLIGFGFRIRALRDFKEQPLDEDDFTWLNHTSINQCHRFNPTVNDTVVDFKTNLLYGRIFYAFSLFAFYVRLMYIFSFSIVLGPKLIMINRMVIHDLLPFLLILSVCQTGYGLAAYSISLSKFGWNKNAELNITETKLLYKDVFEALLFSYFQMVGDVSTFDIKREQTKCMGQCQNMIAVMIGAYKLLTQVLMFNLLVATFTSTYNEIEGSSHYFWCYQRYEMIQEFVDKSSLAPPFMLIWYVVEFTSFIAKEASKMIMDDVEESEIDDPFCCSLTELPTQNNKLTKWEQMIGSRRTRVDAEPGTVGAKWGAGGARSDARAIILRATGGGPGGGKPGVGGGGVGMLEDGKSLMQVIGPLFGPETEFIEDRFHEVTNRLSAISSMEEKLAKIVKKTKTLIQNIQIFAELQNQTLQMLKRPDGKRLVGCGKPAGSGRSRNAIIEAVTTAITGLDSYCQEIEDKVAEKLKIEKLCVTAVLTRSEEEKVDVVLAPKQPRSKHFAPTGRILERVLFSHRLWRIVPFNFELHPGIRMNVPEAKIAWKTLYKEYHTYKATEDRLGLPYTGVRDPHDIPPDQIAFNEYDSVQGVSRAAIRGKVHLYKGDSLDKYPLNPAGRSGLNGKGLLLHWGPNHSIALALTRPHPEGLMKSDLPVMQVAVLERNRNYCLPWYLIDHRMDCDFQNCSATVIKAFLARRTHSLLGGQTEDLDHALASIKMAELHMIYAGYLHDHLNADHAWIETVFLNLHQSEGNAFTDDLIKIFVEDDPSEEATWINVGRQVGMRSSHDELVNRLATFHNAFYTDVCQDDVE